MPLFFQQDINVNTRLAVWHITEPESFFLEKAFLQRSISHPQKRLQHLAARYLLQLLFPEFPQKEILIADTRKPYLPEEQFQFSVSHCGNYAAVIISSMKRVGIDIEQMSDRVQNIASRFLHPDEMKFISPENGLTKLTVAWSVKESIFKWWGLGEIDFSEVLRFNDFNDEEKNGVVYAAFNKEAVHIPLQVNYKIFDDVILTWLATDQDIFKMTN